MAETISVIERSSMRQRLAVLGAAGALAMSGCSSNGGEDAGEQTRAANVASTVEACEADYDGPNVYANPGSIFHDIEVEGKLATEEVAGAALLNKVCEDKGALAVLYGMHELFTNAQADVNGTKDRIQAWATEFTNSNERADQARTELVESGVFTTMQLRETTAEDKFFVLKSATQIVAARNGDNQTTSLSVNPIDFREQSVEGMRIGVNLDNADLTDTQKQALGELSNLMIIARDGTVVINDLIGQGSITVEENQDETPANVNVDPSAQPVDGKPRENNDQNEADSKTDSQNNSGTSQTNTGGSQGTTGGSSTGTGTGSTGGSGSNTGGGTGTNGSDGASSGGEADGGCGGSCGEVPSTGGGGCGSCGGGGESPTPAPRPTETQPEPTPPPPTQEPTPTRPPETQEPTPTRPPETQEPTPPPEEPTPPPPTQEPTKPPMECDPNIDDC